MWLFLLGLPSVLAAPPVERETIAVAETARRAVVHIEVETAQTWAPALEELLRSVEMSNAEESPPESAATGSGFFVSSDGLVVTNYHVVASATSIHLVFSDDRRKKATVVASDPRTDLAILQAEPPGPFPFLRLSKSEPRVGQVVLAVGSPFDFTSTVTTGIISATGRRGLERGEIQDFIQTDAAINPGNSGGPLLDLKGQVIGVNTAIYTADAEQYSGISFAIPASLTRTTLDALTRDGRVPRPAAGFDLETINDEETDGSSLSIRRVIPNSPAYHAGLRRGDIVTSVNGRRVQSADDVIAHIAASAIGVGTVIGLRRGSEPIDISVTLTDRMNIGTGVAPAPKSAFYWLGMHLIPSSAPEAQRLGVSGEGRVAVAHVEPGSPAFEMGVMAGDIVDKIGTLPIPDLDMAATVIAQLKDGGTTLRLTRGDAVVLAILASPLPAMPEIERAFE